jgi:RES domain-containing protein
MHVFRLCRRKYATPLSGKGAALKGARWNSPGIELMYTAGNRSLAMAEVAVHMTVAMLPDDYVMLTLDVPDGLVIEKIAMSDLPADWKDFPHPPSTQQFGDRFVPGNKSCVLQVPSAVSQGDVNFLVNPNHKDFEKITVVLIEDFPFDHRIFR